MKRVRVFTRLLVGLAVALWCFDTAQAEPEDEDHGKSAAHGKADTSDSPDGGHESDDHGGSHGGNVSTNPLEWKTDLALWTGVVFLVLMTILWRFAWGPIRDGLQRREDGIANQIAEAEESNREAKFLLAEYEKKLAASKAEVREILEQGRRDAEKTGRDIVEQARVAAQAEQKRALQQIDTATAAALKELAEQGADLAVSLAGKIVQAELKPSDHSKLIRQTVADFAKQAPSEN